MSKKTKSGAKAGEIMKKVSDSSSQRMPDPEVKEKSVYLAQIQYLLEKLERYEQKCDELEKQKEDLILKNSALEREKGDIVDFLRHSLLEKEEQVETLSQTLDSLQQTTRSEQEKMRQQHRKDMAQLQNRADTLKTEKTQLVERLDLVEKFLQERDELMENVEALKKQLSEQEEEHRLKLHDLDLQALMEKKRWEKKMESHVRIMEADVQRLVHQRLTEITKVTLQENKQLKERFELLSEHAQGLVQKNTALYKRKTEAELDVENLEQMLRDVSRSNCVQKKLLEQLTERCAHLQTDLDHCTQKHQKLHSLHTKSVDEMDTLRQDQASFYEQCNKNQHDIDHLEAELQQERRKRSEEKRVLQQGLITLKRALTEVDLEECKEHADKWKLLLLKLLVVLDPRPENGPIQDKEPSKRLPRT